MIFKVFLVGFLGLMTSCWGGNGTRGDKAPKPETLVRKHQSVVTLSERDSSLFHQLMDKAQADDWSSKPFPEMMVAVAREFTGTPYVASTLETDGPERLVVNLGELDCTTYAENVLALSLCIHRGAFNSEAFTDQLRQIRYRGGVLDQYPSRLHYFSDWLVDNQKKGLMEIVSNPLGDAVFDKEVNFMSTHSDKYAALANHPEWVGVMANIEKRISSYDLRYISGDNIDAVAPHIKDGDLIGFCSTVSGLDVSHVAIALHLDDGLHFIHASSNSMQVEVSSVLLSEYVLNSRGVYGILLGRAGK